MSLNIHFTQAASAYCKKMLEKNKGAALRLSVKKTGCSGFAYDLTMTDETHSLDLVFEPEAGLKIFVDSASLHFLEGLKVDFVTEEKLGLKQSHWVYENANESSRCGCGKSFHVD